MKTLTVSEICQLNDLSLVSAEKLLANLQAKGLVSGFVPGNPLAPITLLEKANAYFS